MLGFHQELIEIQRPNSKVLILWACDTKGLIDRDWVNSRVISSVGCFQSFIIVVDLVYHASLACYINSAQTIFLWSRVASILHDRFWSRSHPTQFKIEAGEDCISGILVEYDCWSSDISRFLDAPESDILFTTADKLIVVDWAEFERDNVELWHLLCENLCFLSCMNSRNIPHNNHFFSVALCCTFFTNTGKEATIWGEGDALERSDWHGQHLETSRIMVIPNTNDWVFAFLGRGNQPTTLGDVKAANRSWMPEEEPLLLVCLHIHCN